MSRKGIARSRKAAFDEGDLSRLILVDGEGIPVKDASAEEFDIYVFDILGRMYAQRHRILQRYGQSFDYDWRYLGYRVIALNELYQLNLARRSARPPKPKVPLFAKEEEHVHG